MVTRARAIPGALKANHPATSKTISPTRCAMTSGMPPSNSPNPAMV